MTGNSSNSSYFERVPNHFVAWDYVVFAVLLAASSAIGLYHGCTGRKQSTTSEFLMAGRSMDVLPVALSLLASFMSAITLLGTPAEVALYGTHYWMIALSYFLVIPGAAYLFVPVFYSLNLTSIFEYLEKRFSKGVRTYGCLVYIVQTELYLAIALYAPCLALSAVTGLNKWIAVCLLGVVCTFYTTIGGMKAVMWTDVLQIILMFLGMLGIIIKGSVDFGGFANIWRINEEHQRVFFWDPDPNPLVRHTFWSLFIGGAFTWLAIYGVNQAQVQRALCTPTLRQGQIAMWINLPGLIGLLTICSLCGMVLFARYSNCNPLAKGYITENDQLIALYVMDEMNYPGFPGFFTACIFSGALSSISSGLNSLAAVFLQDLLLNYRFNNLSDSRAALASKLLSLIFGALMILLTLVASQLGGVLQAALGIFGIVGGPILGLFILGIFYPWTNQKGAYVALTLGLALSLWLGVGAQVYRPKTLGIIPPPMTTDACPNVPSNHTTPILLANSTTEATRAEETYDPLMKFYQISYMWYSAFAVLVTTTSGLLFSLLTGPNKASSVDSSLLNPLVVKLIKLISRKDDSESGENKSGHVNAGFNAAGDNFSDSIFARPNEITKL